MSSPSVSLSTTSRPPHKNGAFDMDENAIYRAVIVIGGIVLMSVIYCVVRCFRYAILKTQVKIGHQFPEDLIERPLVDDYNSCVRQAITKIRRERSNSIRSRVRKYDLMSDRDLQQTALTVDSDSEDDLFEPPSSDRQKLVTIGSS